MKKRIFSLILVLTLCLTLLPVSAAAASPIPTTGLYVQSGSDYYSTSVAASSAFTYTAGSGTVSWNPSSRTLTLTNATIPITKVVPQTTSTDLNTTYTMYAGILINTGWKHTSLTINLIGENTITGTGSFDDDVYGIYVAAQGKVTITGNGSLTIKSEATATRTNIAFKCYALEVQSGATLECIGGPAGWYSHGLDVSSGGDCLIVGGTVRASGGNGSMTNGSGSSQRSAGLCGTLNTLTIQEGGVLETGLHGSYALQNDYGTMFGYQSGVNVTVDGTWRSAGTNGAIGLSTAASAPITFADGAALKGSGNVNGTGLGSGSVADYAQYKYVEIAPETRAEQNPLSITNQPTGTIHYGDSFKLDTSGGSGEGAVNWTAAGPAEVTADGTVTVTGVGAVTVTATKAGDTTYAEASATCAFTSEKATPNVGEVTCTEDIHPGTAPATVSLQHSGTTGGTAKLKDDTTFELGEKEYDWVFTPADTANYTTATGTVKLNVTQAALSSIAVTTQPSEKTYTVGDTFDPAGMVVTAAYADGTTAVISDYEVQYTSGTALKVSDTSVTLRYTEGSVTKTCTLSGLTVNKKTLAPLNAEVSARYSDTTEQSFDLGTLLPTDCGTVSSVTVSSVTSSDILASASGDKDTKTVLWALKSGLSGEEKNENLTITISTENYSDITIQLKVTATVKTPVDITGVTAQNGTYNGKSHTGYTGTPAAGAYPGDLSITYDGGSAPVNVGNYTVTIAVPDSDETYTGSVTLSFQIEQATVTVKADDKTATVGGARPALTATVSGLAEGDALKTEPTLACDANMNAAGTYEITASGAAVPDGGNYRAEIVYQPGTLTIRSGSSGSSSSGGSSSNTSSSTTTNPDGTTTTTTEDKTTGTVTETTKNKDGSQTVVETRKDGTITTTETDAEGNKSREVQSPDGSRELTVTRKDGTTATVATDTGGKMEAEVKLPSKVVSEARESGEAIALPIPEVNAAQDTKTASAVTVKTGSKEPVKVEIPVADPAPGTVAVIVNADGTEEIVKTSVPSEDGVVVALPDDATVKIVDNSKDFVDVPAGNWATDAVSFISARELFSGTSENTFSPDALMTRAMLMTVLARFDGENTSGGANWYEKGMKWAAANGISDGSDPTGNISREQLAVMLWRYAGSPAATSSRLSFVDAHKTNSWAMEAMLWATEKGIINGKGDDILDPTGTATRAQTAQMLKNFLEKQ